MKNTTQEFRAAKKDEEMSMEQAAAKQKAIDVSNLRLYARLFRENQWEDKVLHWSVFEATLAEIADRIEADTKADEAAHARSRCQRCGCCLDRNEISHKDGICVWCWSRPEAISAQ